MAIPTFPSGSVSLSASGNPFIRKSFGGAVLAVQKNLVFVIMSFQRDTDDVYAVIQGECLKLHLDAKRVDEAVGSDFVIKEIGSFIERAEFIICDLTHERPNVYYELGYAHGVGNDGNNILLIAKEGTLLHFDIGPLRVQYYASTDTLRALLARNLSAMLKAKRVMPVSVSSPAASARTGSTTPLPKRDR